MKIIAFSLSIFYLIVLSSVFFYSCSHIQYFFKYYPQDNYLEELAENILKQETDIDVDLSPFSEEKN